jgi:hypothetical protein
MNTTDMTRQELRAAAKKAGIKYGKMSLLQIRNALADVKPGAAVKSKKEKVRKERTGTKMESAMKILADNGDKSRKEIIALFQSKAKLTAAGANTYYQLCQKKLKS